MLTLLLQISLENLANPQLTVEIIENSIRIG